MGCKTVDGVRTTVAAMVGAAPAETLATGRRSA
jgi:hypothetical protein